MTGINIETSTKTSNAPDIPFILDGREFTARPPKQFAWGALARITNRKAAADELLGGPGVFLENCLETADAAFLERRLFDRDDDLDVSDLLEVIGALVEQWEPYLEGMFADLTGQPRPTNRAARRQPRDHQPPRRPVARTTARRAEAEA